MQAGNQSDESSRRRPAGPLRGGHEGSDLHIFREREIEESSFTPPAPKRARDVGRYTYTRYDQKLLLRGPSRCRQTKRENQKKEPRNTMHKTKLLAFRGNQTPIEATPSTTLVEFPSGIGVIMANRDEIIKRNIEFMYGRGEKTAIADPDKFSYAKSHKFDENADAINDFSGEFEFLSPAFPSAVFLPHDALQYPSFEHALQASKIKGPENRKTISELSTARELKKMGSKFAENAAQWREVGVCIAEQILRDKFLRNKDIRQKLIDTKRRRLVFKNSYGDQYWGVNEADGKGQNMLGKCIEKVRLQIERGEDAALWLKDRFPLSDPDDICVAMLVKRGRESVGETEITNKNILYVGKTADNEILCENPSVSRRHAVLVADSTRGLLLIDLHSANKTFVNDTEVAPLEATAIDKADCVRFASSSRTYQFMLESGLVEQRRKRLYDKVANPEEDKSGRTNSEQELTVFVGNLSFSSLESEVRDFFETCGEIVSLSLPKDKLSGEGHRGIAFVQFSSTSGLTKALMKNGDELQGRPLKIVRQSADRNAGKDGPKNATAQNKSKDYSSAHDEKSYYTRNPGAPPASSLPAPPRKHTDVRMRQEDDDGRNSERRRRGRSRSSSPSRERHRHQRRKEAMRSRSRDKSVDDNDRSSRHRRRHPDDERSRRSTKRSSSRSRSRERTRMR